MKVEFANSLPLTKILSKLHCKIDRREDNTIWYIPPYSLESGPSLCVNSSSNTWLDSRTGQKGRVVDLVIAYLASQGNRHSIHEALRYIKNIHFPQQIKAVDVPLFKMEDADLTVSLSWPLLDGLLLEYLESRGITPSVATRYLSQIQVYSSVHKKHFLAVGIQNEDGGVSVRNPFVKGYIGKRYPVIIPGSNPQAEAIHIFDDITDFLSIIVQRDGKPLEAPAIILTCLSCLHHATPYFSGGDFKMVFTWMDNDDAGREATANFASYIQHHGGMKHVPMNSIYVKYKDLNAWHMHKLGLAS